jgi:hypothetical protein
VNEDSECLTNNSHRAIRKESAHVIANIAGGSSHQVERLIAAGACPVLIELLNNSIFEVKKEVHIINKLLMSSSTE